MDDFPVGKRKKGSSFAKSNEDIGLSDEVVESFHEILGDQVSPPLLVIWVLHNGSEDFTADGVHVLENVLGDFEEDDIVFEVLFCEFF